MRRGRAAEIARGATVDVGDVTPRFPPPGRFAPGLADRAMHRRTRVEATAGTKEPVALPHCPEGVGALCRSAAVMARTR